MSHGHPRFGSSTEIDFVVVGAGAAGGIIAKELASAGFRVVVLEQGVYMKEPEFDHDELKFMRRRAITNDYSRQPNTFRQTEKEKAKLQPAVIYGRQVGGGTVHFTANFWRFHEIDFNEKSRWGSIAGTGFADWPISYAELEPYYTKLEWELGVSGLAGASPFDPPRSKPFPLPPLPIKSSGALAELGARKLGWHAFPAPMAVISQPYRGRQACAHCGFCEYFGCEMKAKSSTLATVIPEAEKTGQCEIRANCYVRKIETNNAGLVTGVIYYDADGREQLQKAKAVVLCANGAETPRLLWDFDPLYLARQQHAAAQGAEDIAQLLFARVQHEVNAGLVQVGKGVALIVPQRWVDDGLIAEAPATDNDIRELPLVRRCASSIYVGGCARQSLSDCAPLGKPLRDTHDRRGVEAPGELRPCVPIGA